MKLLTWRIIIIIIILITNDHLEYNDNHHLEDLDKDLEVEAEEEDEGKDAEEDEPGPVLVVEGVLSGHPQLGDGDVAGVPLHLHLRLQELGDVDRHGEQHGGQDVAAQHRHLAPAVNSN